MFTTQEAIAAEISYRMERAQDGALRAQVERPSLLRGLFSKKAPRTGPRVVTRGRPLSARI
ncbi:hypothetical protein [Actinophytocola algeriensis]|jgi:hypothetical protein|uniref:Uncharacterized protein n=1 Tax=Actinophytocola algeriensis TaxID=1768010 RepID=A0A7W7Q646_9PSEU|nr:hypothetical protein [Actinophytocola algeriensis]MBB4907627.1 hypothetical protein [Actinophytocola algeriensis]MBE1479657.1 hypothetical protein [Actinophytocola algeriensis]